MIKNYINPNTDIKTLRFFIALASISIVLTHANLVFPGNPFFLDTFFIFSGFFINNLLIKDWHIYNKIHTVRFWLKRIIRIYVPLIAVVIMFLIFEIIIQNLNLPPNKIFKSFTYNEIFGAIFGLTNFLWLFDIPRNKLLDHVWFLSIELQFYFIYPLLFPIIAKFLFSSEKSYENAHKKIFFGLFIIVLLSYIAKLYCYMHLSIDESEKGEFIYNISFFHIDVFAVGIALSFFTQTKFFHDKVYLKFKPPLVVEVFIMLIYIYGYCLSFVGNGMFNWFLWLQITYYIITIVMCLIGLNKTSEDYIEKEIKYIDNKYVIFIAKHSYGIYVFHYPILTLMIYYWNINIYISFFVSLVFSFFMSVQLSKFQSMLNHQINLKFPIKNV